MIPYFNADRMGPLILIILFNVGFGAAFFLSILVKRFWFDFIAAAVGIFICYASFFSLVSLMGHVFPDEWRTGGIYLFFGLAQIVAILGPISGVAVAIGRRKDHGFK